MTKRSIGAPWGAVLLLSALAIGAGCSGGSRGRLPPGTATQAGAGSEIEGSGGESDGAGSQAAPGSSGASGATPSARGR